jgi:hypothetical protein
MRLQTKPNWMNHIQRKVYSRKCEFPIGVRFDALKFRWVPCVLKNDEVWVDLEYPGAEDCKRIGPALRAAYKCLTVNNFQEVYCTVR